MSLARNLIRDLVEKRLWPVALLLVVAIVAIPVLLGGGNDGAATDDAALPAAPAVEAPASEKSVDVALVGPPAVKSRPGATRDPFRQPAEKKAAEAAQASAEKSGGQSAPSASTPAEDKQVPQTTPQPFDTTPLRTVHRVSLTWSQGEDAKERRVSRLTPLGGLIDPALVFLGVSDDKYAAFLLGPQSTSEGEGVCADGSACRVIGLKPGRTQIVEVARDGAEPVQYQLEVASIEDDVLGSLTAAKREHDRVHPDGRDILRGFIEDRPTAEAIVKFGYDRDRGFVVRVQTT